MDHDQGDQWLNVRCKFGCGFKVFTTGPAAHLDNMIEEHYTEKHYSADFAQRARDMAEYDPSKTAAEWLEWLKAQLVGDYPPVKLGG